METPSAVAVASATPDKNQSQTADAAQDQAPALDPSAEIRAALAEQRAERQRAQQQATGQQPPKPREKLSAPSFNLAKLKEELSAEAYTELSDALATLSKFTDHINDLAPKLDEVSAYATQRRGADAAEYAEKVDGWFDGLEGNPCGKTENLSREDESLREDVHDLAIVLQSRAGARNKPMRLTAALAQALQAIKPPSKGKVREADVINAQRRQTRDPNSPGSPPAKPANLNPKQASLEATKSALEGWRASRS